MDLHFYKPEELVQIICARLKQARLLKEWTQAELARRSATGVTTISNLEAGRNINFETLVRVAMVLGKTQELTGLFEAKPTSLDAILKLEKTKNRQRIREKKND